RFELGAEGFLLVLTFLGFAGDELRVLDILRRDHLFLVSPAVDFLVLDLLDVALILLALERDKRRLLARLFLLGFAEEAEDDLDVLLDRAALFLLRPLPREGDVVEAPSTLPLVDAVAMTD
ncbi:unnamed protein product, partial [Ixodes hexagonus]